MMMIALPFQKSVCEHVDVYILFTYTFMGTKAWHAIVCNIWVYMVLGHTSLVTNMESNVSRCAYTSGMLVNYECKKSSTLVCPFFEQILTSSKECPSCGILGTLCLKYKIVEAVVL